MRAIQLMMIFIVVLVLSSACNNEEESMYTGRETRYTLLEGSYLDATTSGYVTVKERTDQSMEIQLFLEGTLNQAIHPVHLHYGSLQDDGLVAEFLQNVEDVGNNHSQSITHLTQLADGSAITYDRFINMNGSIKVHFEEDGPLENVILGATNIGTNYRISDLGLTEDIIICNSNTQ